MITTIKLSDGRVSIVAGDLCETFPRKYTDSLLAIIRAAESMGAADARARIRKAMGVDERIENETRYIFESIGP